MAGQWSMTGHIFNMTSQISMTPVTVNGHILAP